MKNGMTAIMKKELARFFGDKRMVFTTVLMPGLLIFVMYSFMGNAMGSMFSVEDDYLPTVEAVATPELLEPVFGQANLSIENGEAGEIEEYKRAIADQELDLCVVFPEDFDESVASYDPRTKIAAPNVEIYYNSASTESGNAYEIVTALLDGYESSLTNLFDINRGGEGYDMASQEDTAGMIFSSMMPMLLMIFLFTGCMAVAPEAIAGEKERGTIATLLVTPLKRRDLAIGKIAALALIALLSGLSSTAGTVLALPKLMGAASDSLDASVYGPTEYAMLGLVILSTVLILITVISIISAFAKTIKEAQTAVTPLMILVMFVGISAMFGSGAKDSLGFYAIPVYNSVQCMIGIFGFEVVPVHIGMTVASNLVYTAVGVFLLAKMFQNEKIVFSK